MDSTTSGFNISKDLTKNLEFNNILGFSKQEVAQIMDNLEISKEKQEELLPIIKESYDGYIFSDEIEEKIEKYRIYNSNMTFYFLNEYIRQNKVPQDLLDTNIVSDYGKIETIMQTLEDYLTNLSNRDYSKFSEKYVKVIFYTIARTIGTMNVKSEMEIGGNYSDILLIPRQKQDKRYGVLLEFKYIKKEEYEKDKSILAQKQKEAKEQVKRYKQTEEIKQVAKLKSYTVVVVKDKVYVEEV